MDFPEENCYGIFLVYADSENMENHLKRGLEKNMGDWKNEDSLKGTWTKQAAK
jgi:hypothetical protein